jgi:hypothetical protein
MAMNFRHQRTSGIKDRQSNRDGLVLGGIGNIVLHPSLWNSRGDIASHVIADSLC